jgi:hypothetical protein
MRAVEALLRGAIDYAGLFPPASLELERTVENYAAYRAGVDAWALGRLVIPASKLAEFADRWPEHVAEWPISLLLGSDYDSELRLAVDVGLQLDCVECKVSAMQQIADIRKRLPSSALLFVERPAGVPIEDLLAALADVDACAKLRTGGVTADAIPGTAPVAQFLARCAESGVRMKATAGLHHTIRGEYALTYEAGSAKAWMHGFVNFFLAAVLAGGGASDGEVDAILADSNPASFSVTEDEIRWRDTVFCADRIETMREGLALSFGSCSFEEPMQEMRAMGWIE